MIRLLSLRAAKFKQLDDLSLAFPQRGSVLVQGLNEAGKSTLFESIFFALFGKALVTEEPNRLDDLVNYQAPRALVKLAFATDGATFAVSRTLNRGKPNSAVLDIEYAAGKRETVTNLSSVNRRIVEELRLDADALLNSCFVEQKKLEKLEAMTAQQRRDTLLRLLNLDRLAALEARYKPASSDDYQLQQLRDRLKLAEVQRDLPLGAARLEALDAELRLLSGVRLRWEIASLGERAAAETRVQAGLERESATLAEALAEVDGLKTVRDLSRAAGERLLAMAEDQTETERLERELARLQAQAADLPRLDAEVARLERLAAALAELAGLDQAQAARQRDLLRATEAAERVRRLESAAAERRQAAGSAEAELADLRDEVDLMESAERDARTAGLLQNWLQIREVAAIAQEGERELARLRQEVSALDGQVAEHAADRHVKQWTAFGLAVAALLAVGLAGGLMAAHIGAGLAGIPLAALLAAACWLFAVRAGQAGRELKAAEAASAGLRMDLNRREGEQSLAQRTGQDPARLASIEAELASLGVPRPTSVADAHQHLAAVALPPQRERPGEGSPAASVAGARQRLGELEGRRQALQGELAKLADDIVREGEPERAAAQLEADIRTAAAELAERRAAIEDEAASEAEAREQVAAARAASQAAEDAAGKASELGANLEVRRQRAAERQAELAATWDQLLALRPGAAQEVDACRALWREVGERIAELDEPALHASADAAGQALATSRERARVAELRAAEAAAELAALALDDAELSARESQLAASAPDLDQQRQGLERERAEVRDAVAALRDRQVGLEQQLGLQGVAVDFAEAEQGLATFERELQVRRQAYRIVGLARKNVVGKVLPSTIRNMSLLLPLLTNDRYRDVDIDPETYKIKVWDETARAMKAKDIFSGGTRDQFSLALRLAFALATLPEELGAAPGFIFLDEPLSSFDAVRSDALVNLLTRGPVAANFDQIFVISHSRAFDEGLFDYHLQLESGRLVASDLPAADAEPADAPQLSLELAAAGAAS